MISDLDVFMKKRLCVIISVIALLFGACGNETVADNGKSVDSQNLVEGSETSEEALCTESENLYKDFLGNNISVHMNIECDQETPYFKFDESKDYTLKELVEAILDGHIVHDSDWNVEITLDTIEYAFIDCGNDGIPELALCIKTPQGAECWNEYIIIKDIDGKLESVYSDVGWSRSYKHINEYGYIYNDGSGGAAYHSFEKYYIDASGNLNFLYEDWTEGFYISEDTTNLYLVGLDRIELTAADIHNYSGEYIAVGVNMSDERDSENYRIRDYIVFAKPGANDIDSIKEGFKDISYIELITDDSLYSDSSPLKRMASNANVPIISLSELYSLISNREIEVGLSDEIKDGIEVRWQELNIDWQPTLPYVDNSEPTVQVDSESASDATPVEIHPGDEVILKCTINIRTSPDSSSDKVAVAAGGETIRIISGDDSGWTEVEYNGEQGYTRTELLIQ